MAASAFRNDDKLHLKHLLADAFRCHGLMAVHTTSNDFEMGFREGNGRSALGGGGGGLDDVSAVAAGRTSGSRQRRIILDYSRQHVTGETMELLFDLADRMGLTERIHDMRSGYNVNFTEGRAVMHHVLRLPKGYDFKARHPQGDEILGQVHSALDRVETFSEDVREGRIRGCTGKKFKNIVCIGIGGAHSGPEAIYEALRGDADASKAAEGRGAKLLFIANIDPVDFDLCTRELNPDETLFIVNSKSFETAETTQNARTARRWLVRNICAKSENGNSGEGLSEADVVSRHFCAVTEAHAEAIKVRPINVEKVRLLLLECISSNCSPLFLVWY